MKKIIILNVVALFVASVAFADGVDFKEAGKTLYGAAGTVDPGESGTFSIGKLSTKVGLGWLNDATGYAIITQHQSGTKAYGTSHDSTAIYVKDVVKKGTGEDEPGASDTGAFATDWKTM